MIISGVFSENRIGVHTATCVSPGSCRAYYELVFQLVYLGYRCERLLQSSREPPFLLLWCDTGNFEGNWKNTTSE